MRRKKERSKQGQTNKAKQHSTPKAVTFTRKNELPQVGLEPTTHVHVCVCTTDKSMLVINFVCNCYYTIVHSFRFLTYSVVLVLAVLLGVCVLLVVVVLSVCVAMQWYTKRHLTRHSYRRLPLKET